MVLPIKYLGSVSGSFQGWETHEADTLVVLFSYSLAIFSAALGTWTEDGHVLIGSTVVAFVLSLSNKGCILLF